MTIATAVLLVAATLVPQSALAERSFQPFKRGAENMLQSPLDVAVSPVTAGIQAHKNLGGKRSTAQRIAGYPFGFFWYTCLHIASSSARFFGGLLELPVGLASLATGFEPGPLFNAADLPALVSYPTPPFDVRFGLYHVSD
jgi:hypothetical protein